jgi:hypothetical protein
MARKTAINQELEYNQSQSLYFSICEALAFIGICAYNLHYIKGILNDRRII